MTRFEPTGSVTQEDLINSHDDAYSDNLISHMPIYDLGTAHQQPPFTAFRVHEMMRDPRIRYGLGLIKGPIHCETLFLTKAESEEESVSQMIVQLEIDFPYVVDSGDDEIDRYIVSVLERFWANGVMKALSAIEWGYAGMEVLFDYDEDGLLDYKDVRLFPQQFTRVCLLRDAVIGLKIDTPSASDFLNEQPVKSYYGIPKAFYHLHQRERNPFYGESRLHNCYATWWEIWSHGGARDVRRNWFFKNAYDGGTLYYKPGGTKLPSGVVKANKDIALEMLATERSGGYRIFPNELNPNSGKPYWVHEPAKGNSTPLGLLEYYSSLDTEELEGMGIPPEVVESSSSNGMGSATGRKIPLLAFKSTLRQNTDSVIYDVNAQFLDALLFFRYGRKVKRTIKAFRPLKAFEIPDDMGMGATPNLESVETDLNLDV